MGHPRRPRGCATLENIAPAAEICPPAAAAAAAVHGRATRIAIFLPAPVTLPLLPRTRLLFLAPRTLHIAAAAPMPRLCVVAILLHVRGRGRVPCPAITLPVSQDPGRSGGASAVGMRGGREPAGRAAAACVQGIGCRAVVVQSRGEL